jgi:hypothetical protein
MRIVVFAGPKGAGKDSCADILKEEKKVKKSVSFAYPLKRICSEVFEVPFQLMNDAILKEKELKNPIKVTLKHLRAVKVKMLDYVDYRLFSR